MVDELLSVQVPPYDTSFRELVGGFLCDKNFYPKVGFPH